MLTIYYTNYLYNNKPIKPYCKAYSVVLPNMDHYKAALDGIKGRLLGSHQHQALKWMIQQEHDQSCKGGVLALDMGLGKTYVSIALMVGTKDTTLIVCPISILHQWRDLLLSFGGIKPMILDRNGELPILPDGVKVVLTTYSTFSHTPKKGLPKILAGHTWGRIILDEGHQLKNTKSSTHVNMCKIATNSKWILTATPIQNCLGDMKALATYIGWAGDIEEFIEKKLLRRTMEQEGTLNPRLKLPELRSELIKLNFEEGRQKTTYANMEREYQTKMEEDCNGNKVLYSEALEGILRCRQVCCHSGIFQPKKRKFVVDDDEGESVKFKWICKDMLQHKKEKCLIFCLWTREIELLLNHLNDQGICTLRFDGSMTRERRENVIYNFNNTPGVRALVIQINAGGVGLNLQVATRVYIMNPTWNPCAELQAIARAHRLGQDQIVTCARLVIEGTVEERMLDVQDGKLGLIADCFDDNSVFSKMGVTGIKSLLGIKET